MIMVIGPHRKKAETKAAERAERSERAGERQVPSPRGAAPADESPADIPESEAASQAAGAEA